MTLSCRLVIPVAYGNIIASALSKSDRRFPESSRSPATPHPLPVAHDNWCSPEQSVFHLLSYASHRDTESTLESPYGKDCSGKYPKSLSGPKKHCGCKS